jgi:glycosyltransferase involved in cell wall biosynthesis
VSVSVIIPCRDRATLVERALTSASLCECPLEVICVDDGSTDQTCEVLAAAAARLPSLTICRHAHSLGAQAARNTGIRASSGDTIAFLDSDDEYLPKSIDLRLAAMLRDNATVVHSECLVVRHPDTRQRLFGTPPLTGNVYARLLSSPGPTYPALMMTRNAIEGVGLLDESIVAFQEWDLAIRLAEHHRFAFVPQPTFIYHCHAGATISKNKRRSAEGYAQIVEKHSDAIEKHLGQRGLATHAMRLAEMFADADDHDSAEAQRSRAFRLAPCHAGLHWLRNRVGAIYGWAIRRNPVI